MLCKFLSLLLGLLLLFAMVGSAQSTGPQTVRIAPGEALKLKAGTTNATAYQWIKNGSAIIDAKTDTYTITSPGIYTVITYNANGCASDPADPITVIQDNTTVNADLMLIKSSETRAITVNEVFEYNLKLKNNGPSGATLVLVTDVLPPTLVFEDLTPPIMGTAKYNLNTKTITWEIPKMAYLAVADLKIKVRATAGGVVKNTATVSAAENDPLNNNNSSTDLKPIIEIKVPNVFTPNNDGKNDYLKITGLEFYSTNEITIVNRWGSTVYEKKGYQNDWTANGLSDGTYFYVLKVKTANSEWQELKGYVTVIR